MARKYRKESEMRLMYERYQKSEQCLTVFCQSEQIPIHILQYWRNKFEETDSPSISPPPAFKQLSLPVTFNTTSKVRILLSNGLVVELPVTYPIDQLAYLLKTVS